MSTKFKPLNKAERKCLRGALLDNAYGNGTLRMDKDTSFVGSGPRDEEVPDAKVIDAIRSVPTHY